MLASLQGFDPYVAAGILTRAAVSLDPSEDLIGVPELPGEETIRAELIREMEAALGEIKDEHTLLRIANALEDEADRLVGPVDDAATVSRLTDEGDVPSDLFTVELSDDLGRLLGEHLPEELQLIRETVREPDQEQHFTGNLSEEGPTLVSLFAKQVERKYVQQGFTMLVAGRRNGLVLEVHQAWRIYHDIIDPARATGLVDLLRLFSEKYGVHVRVGAERKKFFIWTDVPASNTLVVDQPSLPPIKKGRNRKGFAFAVYQPMNNGIVRIALANAIDFNRYQELVDTRGW